MKSKAFFVLLQGTALSAHPTFIITMNQFCTAPVNNWVARPRLCRMLITNLFQVSVEKWQTINYAARPPAVLAALCFITGSFQVHCCCITYHLRGNLVTLYAFIKRMRYSITTLMVIDFLSKLKKINQAIISLDSTASMHLQLAHTSPPSAPLTLSNMTHYSFIFRPPSGFILVSDKL